MDEIYLKIDPNTNRVILIHYDPFSTTSGLMETGETAEQARVRLLKSGIFVTSIPEPTYDSSTYRAVLYYIGGKLQYDYVNIPSGDAGILNTIENAVASIKTILPSTKLLTVTAETENKTIFDVSDIFSANANYGLAVSKNGTYLKNNIDYSITKSGSAVTLDIFSGLTESDYAIAVAVDNLSEHTHKIASVINLQSELDGKAPTVHTHTISQISGLSTSLGEFSLVGHHHTLTDLDDALATQSKAGLVKISDSYTSTATDTAASLLALSNGLASKANTVHTHNYLPLTGGTLTGDLYFRSADGSGDGSSGARFYLGSDMPSSKTMINWDGYFRATKLFNATYNDVAECFESSSSLTYDNGLYKIIEINDEGKAGIAGPLSKRVIGITSGEYGYLLGGTVEEIEENKKIPIGLSGTLWVLAENEVKTEDIGKFICSGKGGKARVIDSGTNTKKYEGTIVGKIVQIDSENNRYRVLLCVR